MGVAVLAGLAAGGWAQAKSGGPQQSPDAPVTISLGKPQAALAGAWRYRAGDVAEAAQRFGQNDDLTVLRLVPAR